tara:strand:+ start:68 stop:502 length:435 start_codon:yes stop_codon:yes gene_type:complete
MVLDDQNWQLPPIEFIKVNEDELLLLDWVVGSASGLIPGATLDELMSSWSSLRFDVWQHIHELKHLSTLSSGPSLGLCSLSMDDFMARILLAIVPTTFRWGTGLDCGYSIKMKLCRFLLGEKDDDDKNQANSDTTNQPSDSSVT